MDRDDLGLIGDAVTMTWAMCAPYQGRDRNRTCAYYIPFQAISISVIPVGAGVLSTYLGMSAFSAAPDGFVFCILHLFRHVVLQMHPLLYLLLPPADSFFSSIGSPAAEPPSLGICSLRYMPFWVLVRNCADFPGLSRTTTALRCHHRSKIPPR